MTKCSEWKIVQASPARTASTVLFNIIIGLIRPNDSAHEATMIDECEWLYITHETNLDVLTKSLKEKCLNLYFICSERVNKGRLIPKPYRDYENVLIFQFEELNTTEHYTVEYMVAYVYKKVREFLPDTIELDKNAAITRIHDMNRLYEEEYYDKPWGHCDNFYHIHGHHRNRDEE